MRINLTRRHALGHDDFPDHGGPTQHHGVAVHREGCDAALAVTRGAVLLDDGSNIFFIGRGLLLVG